MKFKPSPSLIPLLADPQKPFIYRDLSSLQFNERVLEEANVPSTPLLERVKFLSICASNLDEFFMIRLASIGRTIASHIIHRRRSKSKRLSWLRSNVLAHVGRLVTQMEKTLLILQEELTQTQIHVVLNPTLSDKVTVMGQKLFSEKILPELEPPTPFSLSQVMDLENLQMAVLFDSNVWFKIPKKIKSVFCVHSVEESTVYFFPLDILFQYYLASAFDQKGSPFIFRLTRDGDLNMDLEEEDPASIPDLVRSSLTRREKNRSVRLQYLGKIPVQTLESILRVLKLYSQQSFSYAHTLCIQGFWSALNEIPNDHPLKDSLHHPPLRPQIPKPFQNQPNIFDFLKKSDLLLHHPYDSFDAYVEWIRAACDDPNVTKIEQTVYRMDTLSPIMDLLKSAAAQKKIRVVIELRARFDEFNNLRLSDELRKAGVEVAFGFGRLKIHAKVALITRKEADVEVLYAHLSTGNYNTVTARQYTDLSILTANPDIAKDAHHLFESIFRGQTPHTFKQLIPAPTQLHNAILTMIQKESEAAKQGKPARIVGKVNALVDSSIIEKLYDASQAGVKIDLIVRGACSLIPGFKNLSENIRVISIVDRFLEHSRIYYFENSQVMYLSSADWMPRNFFSRLELAFPVLNPKIYAYIKDVLLEAYLNDTIKGKELSSHGVWKKRSADHERHNQSSNRAQAYFELLAKKQYQGTPLDD